MSSPCEFSYSSQSFSSRSHLRALLLENEELQKIETFKVKDYNSSLRLLEERIQQLMNDLDLADTKFFYFKRKLEKEDLFNSSHLPAIPSLRKLLDIPVIGHGKFISTYLNKFHYERLSDETIEQLIPIWKIKKIDENNPNLLIYSFICISIESKMKLDLLNAAGEDLMKIINITESLKIKIKDISDKIKNLKIKINSYTTDWLETTSNGRHDTKHSKKTDFWISSDDLYGTEPEKNVSDSIYYQISEPSWSNCFCFFFK